MTAKDCPTGMYSGKARAYVCGYDGRTECPDPCPRHEALLNNPRVKDRVPAAKPVAAPPVLPAHRIVKPRFLAMRSVRQAIRARDAA